MVVQKTGDKLFKNIFLPKGFKVGEKFVVDLNKVLGDSFQKTVKDTTNVVKKSWWERIPLLAQIIRWLKGSGNKVASKEASKASENGLKTEGIQKYLYSKQPKHYPKESRKAIKNQKGVSLLDLAKQQNTPKTVTNQTNQNPLGKTRQERIDTITKRYEQSKKTTSNLPKEVTKTETNLMNTPNKKVENPERKDILNTLFNKAKE